MKANLQRRLAKKDDEGFTLIELMVVVLIIAILMAIAIPTFLSARGNAQAKAAEANIRNALTDEQTYFTNQGQGSGYAGSTGLSKLQSGDTALSFVTTSLSSTSTSNTIFVATGNDSSGKPYVVVGDVGGDGNAYYAYDDNGAIAYEVVPNAGAYSALPTSLPTTTSSASATPSTWANGW